MSTNSQDQEIDLSQIFTKIRSFFNAILDAIFDCILFIKRNILVLVILFIAGAIIGYVLDKKNVSYKHAILVNPNFGSTDYLYAKVNEIDAKNNQEDKQLLEKIGFNNDNPFLNIEAKPIIDVYKFIQNNDKNFELIKLLSENDDISNIVKEDITSKNYPTHIIEFSTKNQIDESKVKSILKYLNNSEYFLKIKNERRETILNKMSTNDSIILQIDKIINDFSSITKKATATSLVYYNNESNELNNMIKTKEGLINEKGNLKLELINSEDIINEVSHTTNIKNDLGLLSKLKFIIPILFVFMFFVFIIFRNFYKKQLLKRNLI